MTELGAQLYHWWALWSLTSYLTSLCFSAFICLWHYNNTYLLKHLLAHNKVLLKSVRIIINYSWIRYLQGILLLTSQDSVNCFNDRENWSLCAFMSMKKLYKIVMNLLKFHSRSMGGIWKTYLLPFSFL